MAKSGIYKITNKRTGKSYIGQSQDIQKRLNQHKNELNRGDHHNPGLQRDFNMGDRFDFEVIEYTPYLDEREKAYINHFNTFHNGYNETRGGSGTRYSPTYYNPLPSKEVKATQQFIIAGLVFMGLYLLTLYISSLIFRPLGAYGNMVISTIVALFVSIYVILRWKKGFKLGISDFSLRNNKNGATNHNKEHPPITLRVSNQYKLKIYNMNENSYEGLMKYFEVPQDPDRWKQIDSLFKNNSKWDIMEKVRLITIDAIYDNLDEERKRGSGAVTKRDISRIYILNDDSYRALCDYFSAPKGLERERQIEFLFNNNSKWEILEKTSQFVRETVDKNSKH